MGSARDRLLSTETERGLQRCVCSIAARGNAREARLG